MLYIKIQYNYTNTLEIEVYEAIVLVDLKPFTWDNYIMYSL